MAWDDPYMSKVEGKVYDPQENLWATPKPQPKQILLGSVIFLIIAVLAVYVATWLLNNQESIISLF